MAQIESSETVNHLEDSQESRSLLIVLADFDIMSMNFRCGSIGNLCRITLGHLLLMQEEGTQSE